MGRKNKNKMKKQKRKSLDEIILPTLVISSFFRMFLGYVPTAQKEESEPLTEDIDHEIVNNQKLIDDRKD